MFISSRENVYNAKIFKESENHEPNHKQFSHVSVQWDWSDFQSNTERFGEQIFWTNFFSELILVIQYNEKNGRDHHQAKTAQRERGTKHWEMLWKK